MEQHYEISEVDGIRIVSERVPSARSVSLATWIRLGSRDETPREAGWSHFVEHLLFKGNDRLDATAISRYFDGIGSDANAATTKEYTVVTARVLERHLADTIGVFGEMVWHPAFDPDEFESERQVILEEISMYADSPSDVVHELCDELVFGDHELALPIIGTEQSIEAARAQDVAAFHGAAYRPQDVVVSAAGAVDHDKLVELVRSRQLSGVAGRTVAGGARRDDAPARRAPLPARAAAVQQQETEQVHLCLGWPGLGRRDDRRHAMTVLDTILGATPGSRLFVEVRERRGLAYSVYSWSTMYGDGGQIGAYVGVRPDRLDETIGVFGAELERVCRELPDAEEIRRAKDHLEGRTLLAMESTTVRGNRLGASLVNDVEIEQVDDVIAAIHAVDPEEVRALAAELLDPARMSIAVVTEEPDHAVARVAAGLGVPPDSIEVRAGRSGVGAT